jgi:hypothetical protein
MNFVYPFLMLFVPGLIAVCVHDKAFVHITRENWQSTLCKYLIYSFVIMTAVSFIMYLQQPLRTVSFSPWTEIPSTKTHSNVNEARFVFKYSLLAGAAAVMLPKVWENRHSIFKPISKRGSVEIGDDE